MGDAVGRDVLLEAPAVEGVIAARGAPPSNLEVLLECILGGPRILFHLTTAVGLLLRVTGLVLEVIAGLCHLAWKMD